MIRGGKGDEAGRAELAVAKLDGWLMNVCRPTGKMQDRKKQWKSYLQGVARTLNLSHCR
jgi:hypothetical protein